MAMLLRQCLFSYILAEYISKIKAYQNTNFGLQVSAYIYSIMNFCIVLTVSLSTVHISV